MTKQNMKGFVLGVVFTLILVSTVNVVASGIKANIEVLYNNIKLVVDEKTVEFGKDSAGKSIEPFIYNGTTYLPVRSVGEAVGKKVEWDGKTNTIYIGKRNKMDADQLLGDMDYFSKGSLYQWGHLSWADYKDNYIGPITTEVQDNTGKTYNNGLGITLKGSGTGATYGLAVYQEYLLNQEYSKFRGTFALNYENRSTEYANARLRVFADDKLVYTSDYLKKGVMPIDFDIDVKNVIKLKIEIENDTSHNGMKYSDKVNLSIVNAGFYK